MIYITLKNNMITLCKNNELWLYVRYRLRVLALATHINFQGQNFCDNGSTSQNIGKNSAQKEVNNRTDLAYEHIWEDFPEVSLHKLKIRRLCVTVLENKIGSWPLEKQRRTMPYIT